MELQVRRVLRGITVLWGDKASRDLSDPWVWRAPPGQVVQQALQVLDFRESLVVPGQLGPLVILVTPVSDKPDRPDRPDRVEDPLVQLERKA